MQLTVSEEAGCGRRIPFSSPNVVVFYLVIPKTTTAICMSWRCQQPFSFRHTSQRHEHNCPEQLGRTSQVGAKLCNTIPLSGSLVPRSKPRRLADVRMPEPMPQVKQYSTEELKTYHRSFKNLRSVYNVAYRIQQRTTQMGYRSSSCQAHD